MRRSSLRFVRFIFHPSVGRYPIHFPSPASIIRERLFKTARIRSDVGDNKSNKDGAAIQCFLVKKLTAASSKLADGGFAHGATPAVGKIEVPLAGLGIVETEVQTFEVTRWACGLELHQIGAAIPNLVDDGRARIFDPCRRAR